MKNYPRRSTISKRKANLIFSFSCEIMIMLLFRHCLFFKVSRVIVFPSFISFPRRNIRTTNQSLLQWMHQQCNIHFQVKRVLSRQLLPGLTKTNWYLSYNFLTLACIRFTSKPNSQQNESKSAAIYWKWPEIHFKHGIAPHLHFAAYAWLIS